MEWKNVHLRFEYLKNGDLAVCELERANYNKINTVLGIYYDGYLYDAMIKEDHYDPEGLNITAITKSFLQTGKNVKTIKTDVL